MSILSQYIGDTDIIARFRVRQLRVGILVSIKHERGRFRHEAGALCASTNMAHDDTMTIPTLSHTIVTEDVTFILAK